MNWTILNASYTDYTKKQIITNIKSEEGVEFPFYVSLEEEDSSELYKFIINKINSNELVINENNDYSILEQEIREKRNLLLKETDYLIVEDYPIPEDDKKSIKLYRKELRDITQQDGFPLEVIWPERPSCLQQ